MLTLDRVASLKNENQHDHHRSSWHGHHHWLQLAIGRAGTRVAVVGFARGEGALDQIFAVGLDAVALSAERRASAEAKRGARRSARGTGVSESTGEVGGLAGQRTRVGVVDVALDVARGEAAQGDQENDGTTEGFDRH